MYTMVDQGPAGVEYTTRHDLQNSLSARAKRGPLDDFSWQIDDH